jgi:hypothetical protein
VVSYSEEEQRLKILENSPQRRIFRCNTDERTEGTGIFTHPGISSNILMVIKSRRLSRGVQIVHI